MTFIPLFVCSVCSWACISFNDVLKPRRDEFVERDLCARDADVAGFPRRICRRPRVKGFLLGGKAAFFLHFAGLFGYVE